MQTTNTTFHPLAVFEHEILSHHDDLSLPRYHDEVNSVVSLKDTVYLRARDGGQVLSYSLTERCWDTNISTPKEASSGYQLAVCSNNLVLVGGHSKIESSSGRQHEFSTPKVWIRQGSEWNADIIPSLPIDGHEILAAAGSDHHLFVLCRLRDNEISSNRLNTCLYYYDIRTKRQRHIYL